MRLRPLFLSGAMLIEADYRFEARGWLARLDGEAELAARGLTARLAQTSLSLARRAGTLRGLHYQPGAGAQDRLVRCARGAIWEAIVDLRPQSSTYCQWFGAALSDDNGRMLLVPPGFAHGFVALTDDAAVTCHVPSFSALGGVRGVRHDDPAFGIDWPVPVLELSEQDRRWPDFRASAFF